MNDKVPYVCVIAALLAIIVNMSLNNDCVHGTKTPICREPTASECHAMLSETHKMLSVAVDVMQRGLNKAEDVLHVNIEQNKVLNIMRKYGHNRDYLNDTITVYQILKLNGLDDEEVKSQMQILASSGKMEQISKFVASSDFNSPTFWESLKGLESFAPLHVIELAKKIGGKDDNDPHFAAYMANAQKSNNKRKNV